MDGVLRAVAIYFFLLVLFRLSGRRTFAEMTSFDFVLLLIIGEATQQALLGDDFSITNALIVIVTLILLDILLSFVKDWSPRAALLLDGAPMILVENGRPLRERMRRARIDEHDVMEAARKLRGLEHLSQIKYAVLEISGGITVIPVIPADDRSGAAAVSPERKEPHRPPPGARSPGD